MNKVSSVDKVKEVGKADKVKNSNKVKPRSIGKGIAPIDDKFKKICSSCHENKHISCFHNCKTTKDKHQNYCKECNRLQAIEKYGMPVHSKICSKCENKLHLNKFPNSRISEDGKFELCFKCCHDFSWQNQKSYKQHYHNYFSQRG